MYANLMRDTVYACANASCNSISQGGRGNSNCFIGGLDSEIFTGLNYYQRLLVLQGLSNELLIRCRITYHFSEYEYTIFLPFFQFDYIMYVTILLNGQIHAGIKGYLFDMVRYIHFISIRRMFAQSIFQRFLKK